MQKLAASFNAKITKKKYTMKVRKEIEGGSNYKNKLSSTTNAMK